MKKTIRFGSVCSGIEAASVAWLPLGWECAWVSEIEPFPSAVLAHHYPDVPNLGDMTQLDPEECADIDVLVGGTPCQSFSVAGLRKGLQDERGNLTLSFVRLAEAIDAVRLRRGQPPIVIVWENVPGVLSHGDNPLGCLLGALAGEDDPLVPSGERWTHAGVVLGPARTIAWRVLDAQHFGLAQRRKRVFVVASARAGFDPGEVLLECEGVQRDHPQGEEERTGSAGTLAGCSLGGGHRVGADEAAAGQLITEPMTSKWARGTGGPAGDECQNLVPSLNAGAKAAGYATQQDAENGALITTYQNTGHGWWNEGEVGQTVRTPQGGGSLEANVVVEGAKDGDDLADPVSASEGKTYTHEGCTFRLHNVVEHPPSIATSMRVRRLMPVECERLQGFPDHYTLIEWKGKPAAECPDGPRYMALGNSMAVPVMRWIGQRIDRELGKEEP